MSKAFVEEDGSVPVDLEGLAEEISGFLAEARVESFFSFGNEAGKGY
jgi:hypothetical protein